MTPCCSQQFRSRPSSLPDAAVCGACVSFLCPWILDQWWSWWISVLMTPYRVSEVDAFDSKPKTTGVLQVPSCLSRTLPLFVPGSCVFFVCLCLTSPSPSSVHHIPREIVGDSDTLPAWTYPPGLPALLGHPVRLPLFHMFGSVRAKVRIRVFVLIHLLACLLHLFPRPHVLIPGLRSVISLSRLGLLFICWNCFSPPVVLGASLIYSESDRFHIKTTYRRRWVVRQKPPFSLFHNVVVVKVLATANSTVRVNKPPFVCFSPFIQSQTRALLEMDVANIQYLRVGVHPNSLWHMRPERRLAVCAGRWRAQGGQGAHPDLRGAFDAGTAEGSWRIRLKKVGDFVP